MSDLRLTRVLEYLANLEPLMAALWLGLAFFTAGLAFLMYTRWGQYRPLRKCMAMSLFAHLLLAGYATTIQLVPPSPPRAEQVIHVTLGDGPDDSAPPGGAGSPVIKADEQPWAVFPSETTAKPSETALPRDKAEPLAEPRRPARTETAALQGEPQVGHLAPVDVKTIIPKTASIIETVERRTAPEAAERIEVPAAQGRSAAPPPLPTDAAPGQRLTSVAPAPARTLSSDDASAALLQKIIPVPSGKSELPNTLGDISERANPMRAKPAEDAAYAAADEAARSPARAAAPASAPGRLSAPSVSGLTGKARSAETKDDAAALLASSSANLKSSPAVRGPEAEQPIPDAYRLRVAPNRAAVAQSLGGTAETEAAVKAALKWLADNQSADGRWDPRTHEAGKENSVLGHNRQGAGSRADSAMTGLALLAFLGSGHTHRDGPYREDVRRGLEYLMRVQASNGSLGGQATSFEFMYCHAMATCALSEAYGMTRDPRLHDAVRRAIGYTIASQDPRGGGWRYQPGDAGDTSQLGWQLMSLKSAALAGIPMPENTRQGIIRYLQSVASGQSGGLASYRPGEAVTRTMTAEALVCWQFLGLARDHPACAEASQYIAGELPGNGTYNLYYWYYATLGMYQLRGPHWQQWNDALRVALLSRQLKDGPQAGSWDTGDVWGGYGGRVYATAVATLTLEVYYRFLPLYAGVPAEAAAR